MATLFTKMLILFVVMLLAFNKNSSGLTSNSKIRCIGKEKQALLKFKETLRDDGDSLSSWGSENDKKECCKWRGVKCDNHTGHVAVLNLSTWSLTGKISPSLLELQHMKYLDLSGNNFGGNYTPIPNHHLGNVSSLQYLSLGGNYNLSGGNLEWLSYFPLLRHLDLSTFDLSEATNWLELVSDNLPLLEYLNLSDCHLPNQVPPTHPLNSSLYLTVVDLSNNNMFSLIPDAFGRMISLVHLNLAYNDFAGRIPKSFANLSRLESLELKWSHVTEQVAVVLDKLSGSEKSLQILNFDSNKLSGTLPDFTRFSSLRELYLGGNKLTGTFPKSFRHVLPNLVVLEFYGNQISGMLL
ncbi:receptor-like protein EIX1 [Rhododendron vialii]|uniref:receptor-like protein EIX1 n=1 Tax=Rhododendron vialii TaxID=182163 RepID=UPI00265FA25F|nr:receptor-like protein EIX1 [Rhododendron vialii]